MAGFREHNRRQGNPNFRSGGRFGGNRFGDKERSGGFSRGGSRGGFGGRDGGERRSFGNDRPQMHEATCSKCGTECRVPFKPTGSKPVFCSNCFETEGNSSGQSHSPRSQASGSGISQAQFKQLNDKLDKILAVLSELEIEVLDEEDLEDDEEDSEEDED